MYVYICYRGPLGRLTKLAKGATLWKYCINNSDQILRLNQQDRQHGNSKRSFSYHRSLVFSPFIVHRYSVDFFSFSGPSGILSSDAKQNTA